MMKMTLIEQFLTVISLLLVYYELILYIFARLKLPTNEIFNHQLFLKRWFIAAYIWLLIVFANAYPMFVHWLNGQ